ncbi:hypothetical protein [Streptomyces sp. RKAG293]|uniref:hypothetical protein n=1 Tax=Streptomyces sp. RKAG293 TaxID=2893403 RepID=UPI0020335811|nr:hypothetical protein [Streptomyces sp. RKAG293]MCM2420139.1 hypothetical protein [Streptomyces sp. RKAG293]
MPPSSSRAVARTAGALLAATAVLLTAGCMSTGDSRDDPRPQGVSPSARVGAGPDGTLPDGTKVAPGGHRTKPNGSPSASASVSGVPPLGGAPAAVKPAPSPGAGKPSAGPGGATPTTPAASPTPSATVSATTDAPAPPTTPPASPSDSPVVTAPAA